MKVIYFGYDLFWPCLEAILGNKDYEIIKIYSFKTDGAVDFNDRVKALAKDNNIELTEQKITAEELEEQVKEKGAELIFCAGYAYRIPVEKVGIPAINIHPSPLPRGRGPWPMPWAILNSEESWAVTAHKLSEKIDEGDILAVKSFELSQNENYKTLQEKIRIAAKEITFELLENLESLWQNAKKQGVGEYLPEPSDSMRTVYADTPSEMRLVIERAFPENYVIYSNEKRKPHCRG